MYVTYACMFKFKKKNSINRHTRYRRYLGNRAGLVSNNKAFVYNIYQDSRKQ